jgi:hypothetical protein
MNFNLPIPEINVKSSSQYERLKRALVELLDKESKKVLEDIRGSMRSAKSGRTYRRPGGGTYIASAPGESPAVKTGALIRSLRARKSNGGLKVRITAEVKHGKWMEQGTDKIAPRPFMKPARDAAEPRIRKGVDAILSSVRRRSV